MILGLDRCLTWNHMVRNLNTHVERERERERESQNLLFSQQVVRHSVLLLPSLSWVDSTPPSPRKRGGAWADGV